MSSIAAGEFTVQLFGWARARRIVVMQERVRETKAAVGRKLIDVPGYAFRVWVTNRRQSPLELWRDYNGLAVGPAASFCSKFPGSLRGRGGWSCGTGISRTG